MTLRQGHRRVEVAVPQRVPESKMEGGVVSLYSPSVSKIGRLKAIVRALECLLRARVHVPVVSGVAVGSQLQGMREHGL